MLSHMLEYDSRMSFTKMACKSCEQIRKDIMDRQTKKSMEHYLSQNSGELLSCLTNDLRLIYDEYYMSIFHMFMWGSMMFAALVMIAAISPFLLVISMLLGIAPLIIPRLLARKMGVFRKQYSKTMGEYTAKTGELLKGFETLMVTGSFCLFFRYTCQESTPTATGRISYPGNAESFRCPFFPAFLDSQHHGAAIWCFNGL